MARCATGMHLQSLVFDRRRFDARRAVDWARQHGYAAPKVDLEAHTLRVRVAPPGHFEPGSFRTIRLRPGVQGVVACPRARANPASSAGTEPTALYWLAGLTGAVIVAGLVASAVVSSPKPSTTSGG